MKVQETNFNKPTPSHNNLSSPMKSNKLGCAAILGHRNSLPRRFGKGQYEVFSIQKDRRIN